MEVIRIDADALYRAITATGYKLLAYNLDLRTGEVVSRTLAPDEVSVPPDAPSVKPLPKMGGDLAPKKDASPFGPPPVSGKPKLFDDEGPKKPAFAGDFWKRGDDKKPKVFDDFKRESGSKKLAEIFGGPSRAPEDRPKLHGPRKGPSAPLSRAPSPEGVPNRSDDPYYPRIPCVTPETRLEWMRFFAKDTGDPVIRDELLGTLTGPKGPDAFERALRHHLRLGQQWESFYRKQALASAEAWLKGLNVEFTVVEHEGR